MTRVLHVGWGYPPTWLGCGPVIYVHTLALAQKEAGDVPVVACASDLAAEGQPPYAPSVADVDGIPYVHLRNRRVHMHDWWDPRREVSDPACAAAFAHVLREARPDVVHVHNLVGLSFDVITTAKAFGARVVTSLHNYFPLCSRDDLFFADVERCEGPATRSCSNCLGTAMGDDSYRERQRAAVSALNSCDLLLAVSSRVAEIYASQGVRRDLLVVDHIGSRTAERLWDTLGRARVEAARAPAAAASNEAPLLKVAFFGSLTSRKGLVPFLQAVRLLEHPERVEAHVHGGMSAQSADTVNALLRTFSPLHASRLAFDGPFTQPDLAARLAAADVAVLPPRWEDNGPQTVFEALAAGLPVVATRVGGIPDFVTDGENGVLVEEGHPEQLARAIDRLSADPALVRRLRSRIRPPRTVEEHRLALAVHYAASSSGTHGVSPMGARAVTLTA